MNSTLAIIGCGNMAEAILRGLTQGEAAFDEVVGFDPNADRRDALADVPRLRFADSAADAVSSSTVVLIAVKPQSIADALADLPADGKLFVSIAAGVTTAKLGSLLPGGRVVRTMPNTPLMAGRGVVGLCRGSTATADDLSLAKHLFPSATLFDVDESQMDAITAISGSGPAYFYAFVEALTAVAESLGFDAETAKRLAAATFTGSAALLDSGDHDAAELRRRVTSPGGTTAAALSVFDSADLPKIVRDAAGAAERRGRELSGGG